MGHRLHLLSHRQAKRTGPAMNLTACSPPTDCKHQGCESTASKRRHGAADVAFDGSGGVRGPGGVITGGVITRVVIIGVASTGVRNTPGHVIGVTIGQRVIAIGSARRCQAGASLSVLPRPDLLARDARGLIEGLHLRFHVARILQSEGGLVQVEDRVDLLDRGLIEGGQVAGGGAPVKGALRQVLVRERAATVRLPAVLDGTTDGCDRVDLVHLGLGGLHSGCVVAVAPQVEQALVEDRGRVRVGHHTVREVRVALPVELPGRVQASGRRCPTDGVHGEVKILAPNVEGRRLVPIVSSATVRRLPICCLPNGYAHLVRYVCGDDADEALVDHVLAEVVRFVVARRASVEARDDPVMPDGICAPVEVDGPGVEDVRVLAAGLVLLSQGLERAEDPAALRRLEALRVDLLGSRVIHGVLLQPGRDGGDVLVAVRVLPHIVHRAIQLVGQERAGAVAGSRDGSTEASGEGRETNLPRHGVIKQRLPNHVTAGLTSA
mmetsp:Transcript_108486/g.280516  ORF Transcript_108486/g.280516 Transcript_108486/m.280516 type:complete len:494 (+) Transcript_108486:422-1903(+)